MKTERQRLQKELVAPSAYGLYEVINSPGNNFEEKETTSQANGTAIIGQDKDMENIMAMVRVKDYQIITILGAVGLGKTSLAQLVYNHNETSKIFRTQKMWIHVPKGKASIKYIGTYMISRDGGKIHENMTEEDIMNGVGAMLNKYDSYLIVLDGLWSASEKALQNLKDMLTTGSERNVKAIVTTHSEKVAALMSTTKLPYKLDTLSEANILTRHPLFWNMLKKYGKKIIERCEGTPLVANFLGSVVSSGRLSRQWGDYWALLEYVFRPMWLRPMWPMYGTYIATLLGLALINRISVHNMVIRA
jgi:predicted nuclease of predicted toxin-antitoxin system